jgi:translocation and assembly module TamB
MSELEETPSETEVRNEAGAEARSESPRARKRIWFLRRPSLLVFGCLGGLLAAVGVGLYFWLTSESFAELVRAHVVEALEQATGGRVEMASFEWSLLHLEAEADGLVLHGNEGPGEAPYARVERLRLGLSLLGIWSPRIQLRSLVAEHPAMHLIAYPDGTTNQPRPKGPAKPGKSGLDQLFDLQAGRVVLSQGELDFEDRAAAFDFQNRFTLLSLEAHDVSLRMSYLAPAPGGIESYRIDAGATDLNVARGMTTPVHGYFQASMDLTRSAAYLRSLRITSRPAKGKDHTLEVSGSLRDFSQPRWEARAVGDLDMALLEPVFGYPFAPAGLARLNLEGTGAAGEFRADGSIHVEDGSYIGTGVVAKGVGLDAHVHADGKQLIVSSIVARLKPGGQLEGELSLAPWLPPLPGAATVGRTGINVVRASGDRNPAGPVRPPPIEIPVNGKVTARFRDVALDTLLDMVGQAPFQRLGLDARINGLTTADWSKGDQNTLKVIAGLSLTPSAKGVAGETPTSGTVDGSYTQRDGAVELRKLEVKLPASELDAHGRLGAYPLTSPSGLVVDFHSGNLGEFDQVLKDLGLTRYGKAGTAALPVSLAGEGEFHGSWTGSLENPRIAGSLKATQLGIEMIPVEAKGGEAVQPEFVRWDQVEATGSYQAERIEIARGVLKRGTAEIALDGALDASPGKVPEFDGNSVLHMRVRASKVGVDDLLPFVGNVGGVNPQVTGTVDAQLEAKGALKALEGDGWVELDDANVYGEPLKRARAQGTLTGTLLKVASVTAANAAGSFQGSGSYDLRSKRFEVDAKGAEIDVAKIETLERQNLRTKGELGFEVKGSGTFEDPRLDVHARLSGLTVEDEALGELEFTARTANRVATYDASTRLESAQLTLHGQTTLASGYMTQAKLNVAQFNIGALLKMAQVKGLNGESALEGTATVEGPLARPAEMKGEARLAELAVTVAGVHLQSQGGVHATLANGRISLDPLHVTGDQTDLHAQGSLSLEGKQQLDLAASGTINLKLAETLDPDLTAGGTTTFQVEAHGPLKNPGLQGRIDFKDGSLSLEDIPNGLSQLRGTLEFNQNRLEVKSLQAMSGGGLLTVGGYLAYQHGLYADLSVTGKGVRIRYPQGVSSLADTTMHLQGSQTSLLLSGDVLITRFSVSPDLDIAALAATANAVQTIAPPDAPSNHVRLDVHVLSSPQLNFQNAYAKLAGDVDLRLRGTVASPSLLGRVSITEGSATIAGTRYELQRGDVFFTNPVRIEPSIDLNATAHVEDYDITLGLHGTPQKLGVTYRSDPPLPEADVVALLALGRTENQQRLYTQQQQQALANPTTDALLGGALNATVSSRVQKLFGAGSVKLDPNYLGALGNSTSRIIVEEQLSRYVSLTYATNVNTTSQQLIQAEVAINRHVSLVVARDESGVFSMVVKATRRFR